MSAKPTTFAEMIDVLDALPILVRNARRARGLSLRAAAEGSGLSFNALSRLERGGNTDVASVKLSLTWLSA